MIYICLNLYLFYYRIHPNPHYPNIQCWMKDKVVLAFTAFQAKLNALNFQFIVKITLTKYQNWSAQLQLLIQYPKG